MRFSSVALLGLLALLTGLAFSKDHGGEPARTYAYAGSEAISARRIRCDLGWICSDTLEGRGSGARGGRHAGDWLATQLGWLGVQPAGTNGYFQPFTSGGRSMRNVAAKIPGQGSGEAIVIGAHYDHLGYGYQPGAYGPRGNIHNGADDNGSGTTALLQIVRAFKAANRSYRRTIVFLFFDGEERGLLGSKHWVSRPTIRERVALMINLDMVGRLRGSLELSHNGGSILQGYVQAANKDAGLSIGGGRKIKPDSDHWPFYRNQVPVLIPFSGFHDNYHRPSDDLARINFKGIEQIARLSFGVAVQAANDTRVIRVGSIPKTAASAIPHGCHYYHPRAEARRKRIAAKRRAAAKRAAAKRRIRR